MVSVSLLLAALTLALVAMPHCASMCACHFAQPWLRRPFHFQAGRAIAYTLGGAFAGGMSSALAALVVAGAPAARALNAMLMVVLASSALLLVWRGQTLQTMFSQRVRLPAAMQRSLELSVPATHRRAFAVGLLWLLMPCGVLWAALMLAYLSGSAVQGALVMLVFAASSGVCLQLVNALRKRLVGKVGEAAVLRASGVLVLAALGLMAGRQTGLLATPVWLQGLGLCL